MIGSRQRAIADAVAVDVLVAGEAAQAIEVFLGEHFAALNRLLGIFERVGHPVVHAEIEVGHDEHRRLQLLGQVKRLAGHGEALRHRRRQQHGMLGVAVRERRNEADVALRSARRQPSRRPHALDVPDDAGNLDVVAEAGELGHQRDAGSSSGGHGARACPAGAQNHADGGEFILGLHDGESGFAVRPDAVFLHVIDEGFDERGGRRNRVPGHYRHAGKHAAQRGGRVAVDDDHAARLVHALDGERIGLGERCGSIIVASLGGVPVQVGGFDFLGELLAQSLLDLAHVEVQKLGDDADVHHVLDQFAQLGFRANGGHELVVRHGIEGDVGAQFVELQGFVVENSAAGRERERVFLRGLRIHRDQEVDLLLARDIALGAGADGVPGRQSGYVRWKKVLAGNRHAHLKDGAQQNGVRALRTRSVYGCDLDAEIVDDRLPLGIVFGAMDCNFGCGHQYPLVHCPHSDHWKVGLTFYYKAGGEWSGNKRDSQNPVSNARAAIGRCGPHIRNPRPNRRKLVSSYLTTSKYCAMLRNFL